MAIDWSDDIAVVDLDDEPALSDELAALLDRLDPAPSGGRVPSVVLDFSRVTYINSSNIGQLLRLRKRVADAGRSMRVACVSDEVWTVMLATGLDRVFQFAPDVLTALAGLQLEEAAE